MKDIYKNIFLMVLTTISGSASCMDLSDIKGQKFVFNSTDNDDIDEGCVYTTTINYTFQFNDRLNNTNSLSGQVVRYSETALNAQNRRGICPRGSASKQRAEITIYPPYCFDYIINDDKCIRGDCGKDMSGETRTGSVKIFDSGNKMKLNARSSCNGVEYSWEILLRRIP